MLANGRAAFCSGRQPACCKRSRNPAAHIPIAVGVPLDDKIGRCALGAAEHLCAVGATVGSSMSRGMWPHTALSAGNRTGEDSLHPGHRQSRGPYGPVGRRGDLSR